jgi:hypothetical protein
MTPTLSPIEAGLLVVVLALPWFWFQNWQVARLADPRYLRKRGVVIVRDQALDGHEEPIGVYMDRPIWRGVTFKGMHYRFDRVVEQRRRERLAPGELYLEPGLVYIAED